MSRRDDRDRDRRGAAPSARQNEYFLPKEGIDREVITADICRYLGPDALVRPGYRNDPQTRQPLEGYIISAYRNLTTAMISDLKADSLRWENERRNATRGQNPYGISSRDSNGMVRQSNTHIAPQYEQYPTTYSASQTHHARQREGPTSTTASITPSYATSSAQGTVYDDGQYRTAQPQYGHAPQPAYAQQQDYPMQQDGSYVYGGALVPEASGGRSRQVPSSQPTSGAYPREPQYASAAPVYASADPRYGYAQPVSAPQYGQQQQGQPTDPGYGRGGTYEQTDYAYPDYASDVRYQDQGQYSQSMVATPTTTVTAEPTSRRPHGRDDGRHSKHPRSDDRRR